MRFMASIVSHMEKAVPDIRLSVATVLLVVLHLVGVIGLHSTEYSYWFERIAWVNMLISFVVVAAMYRSWPGLQLIFAGTALILGMASEVIGVQYGWLYGDYHYEGIAGPWVLGVPLVIGLNWVLLSICSGTLVAALFHHTLARVVAATMLMVGIDVLLEHFAIAHHLWVWEHSGIPPLMNYVTWAAVAFVLQCLYVALWRDQGNKVAIIYLLVLTAFLLADRLWDHEHIHIGSVRIPQHLISFDYGVYSIV